MCTPVSPSAELEERGGHGEELQDKINSLEKELKFMEVKKNEAINKLAQVRPHPPDIPVHRRDHTHQIYLSSGSHCTLCIMLRSLSSYSTSADYLRDDLVICTDVDVQFSSRILRVMIHRACYMPVEPKILITGVYCFSDAVTFPQIIYCELHNVATFLCMETWL